MQYAGMSEEITTADTPTHATTTTTTSATGTGEHLYEEGEEDSGEDSEEDEYKGEKNTTMKKSSVDSPPPPPPPPHTTTTVDMMKSANAIKSSLLGHEAASKLTKRNFSYFDGINSLFSLLLFTYLYIWYTGIHFICAVYVYICIYLDISY